MFRNILVPLDGSAFSRTAIPYALALAPESEGVLQLVSAVDVAAALSGAGYAGNLAAGAPAYGGVSEVPAGAMELVGASRQAREEELSATAEEVQAAVGAGASVRWAVVDGAPSEAVTARAAESGADLVVMSTHGRGGLERAWLGSIADRLVRRLTVPLLLVRPAEDEPEGARVFDRLPTIRRILVPLDGSELAEAALPLAAGVARRSGAGVVLVRVTGIGVLVDSPYIPPAIDTAAEVEGERREAWRYLEGVAERLGSEGVEVDGLEVREGPPAAAILELAREGADMVAMATHGRGGFRRWLLGSVSDKVLRGADVPVLLVRPEDPEDD